MDNYEAGRRMCRYAGQFIGWMDMDSPNVQTNVWKCNLHNKPASGTVCHACPDHAVPKRNYSTLRDGDDSFPKNK